MFTAKMAGHVFSIDNKYEYIKDYYNDYLSNEPAEFVVSATHNEIEAEDQNNEGWAKPYLESLAIYRKLCENLINDGIILFHSSAIEINGKAILFTAPSGTGKSTHTSLWRKCFRDQVTMINDDKPLIRFDDDIVVYGTPYGGKDEIQNNISAPAAAVIILHQAPVNELRSLSPEEAFPALLNQTYRCPSVDAMMKTMPLIDRLAHLPVYSLGCTISDEAVTLVYNAVFGK